MASSELTRDNFTFLKNWKQKHIVEGIYFADSFGAFLPVDVPLQLRKFQDAGYPSVGFHAHNNLQLAVANTLEAVNAGAEWIDATVMGIGRGAGNAPIEIVLGLLNRTLRTDYHIAPDLEVAHKYYNEVREELNWAVRPETVMGGLKNVHPYYMDDLFSRKIPIDDIWNIADRVKTDCPISYSATAVDNLLLDIGGIPHDRI
jgi:4-hydroxy 2-oxovalerate aldolase